MSCALARVGVLLAVASFVAACSREPPPASPPPAPLDVPPLAQLAKPDAATPPVAASSAPAPSASASAAPPAPRSCAKALPPDDLLLGNLASTSLSAIGEVVASTKTGPGGSGPPPSTGYVAFRYEVRVVRWLVGTGPDQLVLLQRAEADLQPKAPGSFLLFSACTTSPGNGYEPDVGYFFPIDPECRAEAEARGMSAAKRVRGSANAAKKAGSACKR